MLQEPEGLAKKLRSSNNESSLERKSSSLERKNNLISTAAPKIPSSVQKSIIKGKEFSGKTTREEKAIPSYGNGRTEKQIVQVVDYYTTPDTYTVGGNATNAGYVYGTKFIEQ